MFPSTSPSRSYRSRRALQAQADALRSRGIADVDLSPAPELVDAFLRLARDQDAAKVAVDFVAQATAKGQPWALARAARCRALLADAGEMEPCFEEALRLHERTPDAFETARTRLAYGARLRRARKRVRAREQLRAAVEIFEQLGAQPWVDQADAELAATGETARHQPPADSSHRALRNSDLGRSRDATAERGSRS